MNYLKINNECWRELEKELLTYAEYEKQMTQIIRNYCTEIFYIYEKEKYNTMFKEHLTEKAKTLTEKQLYTEMMKEWKKIDKEIYEKHIKPYKE